MMNIDNSAIFLDIAAPFKPEIKQPSGSTEANIVLVKIRSFAGGFSQFTEICLYIFGGKNLHY
jgi:hypothetical protein